ncbi:MAG: cytochrome c oxidase subunit [Gemmatimonadaceae bacterium]|jgi:cytochrome c oxidase subunit 2|nr:cytochrome c oxidase subunit [Gemmatimonadaceae bacterium]
MRAAFQSALDPAGPKAAAILHLNWFLLITATLVYVIVIGTLFYSLRRASTRPVTFDVSDADEPDRERARTLWVAASVAATALILLLFIFVDVSTARSISRVGGEKPLRIDVVGHQWWWEVKYPDTAAPQNIIETANEIHVPIGRAVFIKMTSDDVIHSFWAPNLDGKKDLIPGHETRTWFRADSAGIYRGQCAEFCGHQHAKMAFFIVAEPRIQFEHWLESQKSEASNPSDSLAQEGERVFLSGTCAMCHSISGTSAGSKFGPDLTHLASRRTIAAGTLPNNVGNLAGWILDPQSIKPGVKMPASKLDPQSLQALLAYLRTLK